MMAEMAVQVCYALNYPLNPLSPNSDKHLISPCNIITSSNVQVIQIKEMITNDKMLGCFIKISQLVR